MLVSDLNGKVHNEIIESISARGISKLTPPQSLAIEAGLLKGSNILVAAPTASGKTLVAEIACVSAILSGKKAVYIAPMRALVSEKYSEFREAYPYIKTALSMGDLDSSDPWLNEYDMLFVSTEKFDSLMRHGISWMHKIGCVVFDEVHMIGDMSRGPVLELIITRIREVTKSQIIALSATVGNAGEIAEWMGAHPVTSSYRPVKLVKGVIKDGNAYLVEDERAKRVKLEGTSKITEIRLLEDTLKKGKQLLIFYSTKRNAEAGAIRLAEHMKDMQSLDVEGLDKVSNGIMYALDRPTKQCEKLARVVSNGAAFHHAGLLNAQRSLVEDAFRSGTIKAICSTTTLGLGVNLPAHTVLIRDIFRHSGRGMDRIGVNEVMQLFGRAGRPKYDTEGRAFLQCSASMSVNEVADRYINSDPEAVDSALGVAPVLRTHILSFISTGFLTTKARLNAFLGKTFYNMQYGVESHMERIVEDVVDELIGWEFIRVSGSSLLPTIVGRRISELYIDPLSAKWMIDNIDYEKDTLSDLYIISNTVEMRPHMRPGGAKMDEVEDRFVMYMDSGHIHASKEMSYGYQDEVGAFATSMALGDWMDEKSEESIIEEYKTTPGALYSKISNADWMIYSAIELSKILRKPYRSLVSTRVRLRYGIREELLDLVRLEQIGRARARRLYANGIKSVSDIRENKEKTQLILGNEISKKVFLQLDMD